MRYTLSRTLRGAALAAGLALPLATTTALTPTAVLAQTLLPPPYLSHALDALLLPIDDGVRTTFGLAPEDMGVFVLATAPGGLAEEAGLMPGDVIDFVQGTEILSPEDLDAMVWNWLQQGVTDYTFDGRRAGAAIATTTVITVEYWEETVEITEISSWSSYTSETFSYEEYTAEYSEEISVSYEEQSFEETTEETMTDETTEEAGAEEETAEDACAGEVVDGVCTDGAEEAADEGVDEGGDEEVIDDAGAEEEMIDDGGDEGGDDGGGEGGGEEEIVE